MEVWVLCWYVWFVSCRFLCANINYWTSHIRSLISSSLAVVAAVWPCLNRKTFSTSWSLVLLKGISEWHVVHSLKCDWLLQLLALLGAYQSEVMGMMVLVTSPLGN